MRTGCQKLGSLLTRSDQHEFIKKIKLNRPFPGLTDQDIYGEEAQIYVYCKNFWIHILLWRPSWMLFLILKTGNNDLCQIC